MLDSRIRSEMGIFDQADFSVRFEWGVEGLRAISPGVRTIVVVDVLIKAPEQ